MHLAVSTGTCWGFPSKSQGFFCFSWKGVWSSALGAESCTNKCSADLRVCAQSHSRVQLFAIPSGFSVQAVFQARILERMPFPPPGDLSDPGLKPASPMAPSWAGRFFTTAPPGKPPYGCHHSQTALCAYRKEPVINA